MKTDILVDFQNFISVPLSKGFIQYKRTYFIKLKLFIWTN